MSTHHTEEQTAAMNKAGAEIMEAFYRAHDAGACLGCLLNGLLPSLIAQAIANGETPAPLDQIKEWAAQRATEGVRIGLTVRALAGLSNEETPRPDSEKSGPIH